MGVFLGAFFGAFYGNRSSSPSATSLLFDAENENGTVLYGNRSSSPLLPPPPSPSSLSSPSSATSQPFNADNGKVSGDAISDGSGDVNHEPSEMASSGANGVGNSEGEVSGQASGTSTKICNTYSSNTTKLINEGTRLVEEMAEQQLSYQMLIGNAFSCNFEDVWIGRGESGPGNSLQRGDSLRYASMSKWLSMFMLAALYDDGMLPDMTQCIQESEIQGITLMKWRDSTKDTAISRCVRWNDVIFGLPIRYENFIYPYEASRESLPCSNSGVSYSSRVIQALQDGLDATYIKGCVQGKRTTVNQRLSSYVKIAMECDIDSNLTFYSPSLLFLSAIQRARSTTPETPAQYFRRRVLQPLGVEGMWSKAGSLRRSENMSLAGLSDNGNWVAGAWKACDDWQYKNNEIEEDNLDFDDGLVAPVDDYAKFIRTFIRRGIGDTGNRVFSEDAMLRVMQPVGDFCYDFSNGRCVNKSRAYQTHFLIGMGATFVGVNNYRIADVLNNRSVALTHSLRSASNRATRYWMDAFYGTFLKIDPQNGWYMVGGAQATRGFEAQDTATGGIDALMATLWDVPPVLDTPDQRNECLDQDTQICTLEKIQDVGCSGRIELVLGSGLTTVDISIYCACLTSQHCGDVANTIPVSLSFSYDGSFYEVELYDVDLVRMRWTRNNANFYLSRKTPGDRLTYTGGLTSSDTWFTVVLDREADLTSGTRRYSSTSQVYRWNSNSFVVPSPCSTVNIQPLIDKVVETTGAPFYQVIMGYAIGGKPISYISGRTSNEDPITHSAAFRMSSSSKISALLYNALMIDRNEIKFPSYSLAECRDEFLPRNMQDLFGMQVRGNITFRDVLEFSVPLNYDSFIGADTGCGPGKRWLEETRSVLPGDIFSYREAVYFGVSFSETDKVLSVARNKLKFDPKQISEGNFSHFERLGFAAPDDARIFRMYSPSYDLYGLIHCGRHGQSASQWLHTNIFMPLGLKNTWFQNGASRRPPTSKMTRLGWFQKGVSFEPGPTFGVDLRDPACAAEGVYTTEECVDDGMTKSDDLLHASEVAYGGWENDDLASPFSSGLLSSLEDFGEILGLIIRRGMLRNGTRILSENALKISLQPTATFAWSAVCGSSRSYPISANVGEYAVGTRCTFEQPPLQSFTELLTRIQEGESIEAVASGLSYPTSCSWSGKLGTKYVANMQTGKYTVHGTQFFRQGTTVGVPSDDVDRTMSEWANDASADCESTCASPLEASGLNHDKKVEQLVMTTLTTEHEAGAYIAFHDEHRCDMMREKYDSATIKPLFSTDAVHGIGFVSGATLFPHNIGLGAANNETLAYEIARAVGLEMQEYGFQWNLAPAVSVTTDMRWGRTYESFSSDPDRVSRLALAMLRGYDDRGIIATYKHFLGDGATQFGTAENGRLDQGDVRLPLQQLLDDHGKPYAQAIPKCVPTIMASYNSINGSKVHGSRQVLHDILRETMHFNGLVLGDWNGHQQIKACEGRYSCTLAVDAGVDMLMTDRPDGLLAALKERGGNVGFDARVEEATRRVLALKARADIRRPSCVVTRRDAHRQLARKAVSQSLVPLKNDGVLPLTPGMRVIVSGPYGDDNRAVCGGWTLTWQGTGITSEHINEVSGGMTLFSAVKEVIPSTTYMPVVDSSAIQDIDVVIMVYGETPYAEGQGDIDDLEWRNVDIENQILFLHRSGVKVVSIFISGRPRRVPILVGASNAFVAAWLPCTQMQGVSDVLMSGAFTGRLPMPWPMDGYEFPMGFTWKPTLRTQVMSKLGACPLTDQQPLVSVMLLVCDDERFLHFAIRQVAQQSYSLVEIVIVDDGLIPLDISIVQGFGVSYQYYRSNVRLTIGEKRSRAVHLASGEYIAHWDIDDIHHPDHIVEMLCPLLQHRAEFTIAPHTYYAYLSNTSIRFMHDGRAGHPPFLGTLFYPKKEAIRVGGFANVSLGEDLHFAQRMLNLCNRLLLVLVDSVYVRHTNVNNTWTWSDEYKRSIRLYDTDRPSFVDNAIEQELIHARVKKISTCRALNRYLPDNFSFTYPQFTFPKLSPVCCNSTSVRDFCYSIVGPRESDGMPDYYGVHQHKRDRDIFIAQADNTCPPPTPCPTECPTPSST